MIYFFGTGENTRVVFGGKSLTEEQKLEASLVLETLPPTDTPPGKKAQFWVDPETKEFEYRYVDR